MPYQVKALPSKHDNLSVLISEADLIEPVTMSCPWTSHVSWPAHVLEFLLLQRLNIEHDTRGKLLTTQLVTYTCHNLFLFFPMYLKFLVGGLYIDADIVSDFCFHFISL